jgi:hypothetical protein
VLSRGNPLQRLSMTIQGQPQIVRHHTPSDHAVSDNHP